jgi:hypothetical protein
LSYCFEQAPQALGELVRVTRPDGWLGLLVMNLHGTIHSSLPSVLATAVENNREIMATGDLNRAINGHECHLFRIDEIQELLESCGLTEVELHANGWLVPINGIESLEEHSEIWQFLFEAELRASRESPGAGTHVIAWSRVP